MNKKKEQKSEQHAEAWIFLDVLVALTIVSVSLSFIIPASRDILTSHTKILDKLHTAMEAPSEDIWKSLR